MNPLLQVSEQEIESLNQFEFADILNRLLKAEAQRYGIPPLSVQTTLRINDPDGGIDARIEHLMNVPDTCRIPQGLSVWQYKAGDIEPKTIKTKEAKKPRVQEAIRAGGSYCFVIGKGCSDLKRKNREAAVSYWYAKKKLVPRGRLLTAQNIADWVSDHPAVAMQPCFNRPVHDELLDFDYWKDLPGLKANDVAFDADDQRRAIINAIRETAKNRTEFTHIRITGRAGIGKTRLALEVVVSSELEHETIYAIRPTGLPDDLFSYLEANTNVRLTLVVDDCTYEEAVHLRDLGHRCGNRLLLVTIGHDSLTRGDQTESPLFVLDRLADDAVTRVVHQVVPAMPSEVIAFVVRTSSGDVKLAVAMAEAIGRNPNLAGTTQLTEKPDIGVVLQSMVRNEPDRQAMRALSLLRYVGLDGEVALEGRAVARFIGIEFGELKQRAERLHQSGLVEKRGRYRYVTPRLLAVSFASEVWRARGEDIVNDLLLGPNKLPTPASQEALLERLADLGEERLAAPVVEKLFGPEGLFPTIQGLDDPSRARVIATLVKSAPKAGSAALERVLGNLSRDQLLEFRAGRRYLVWALEGLLSFTDTFWTAALLLLKLAEAENETFSNNATGVWRGIFYTHLGRTSVPAVERHRLIKDALDSPRVETRLLAVLAIETALSSYESRASITSIGGHIVPPQWSPQTWNELWEVRRSALGLLNQALADQEPQVATAAKEVLISAVRGLVREGLANDVLPRLRNVPVLSDLERRDRWELLQSLLYYHRGSLTDEQRVSIQEWADTLLGNNFHDRLRRWVGKVSLVDRQQAEKPLDEIAASMAEEGYNTPDSLRPELAWLASLDAQQFHAFGRRLGQLDSGRTWLNGLVAEVRNGGNAGLLTAYLQGRSDADELDWVEQLLDEWAQNEQDVARAVLDATWRLGGTDRGAARIVALIDKGWLSIPELGWLAWGRWIEPLSTDALVSILQRIVRDESPEGTDLALALVLNWLEAHPQQVEAVAEYALRLLERPCALTSQGMFRFHWEEIAKLYIPRFPAQIARAILNLFITSPFLAIREDARMEVLYAALLSNQGLVWPLIGEVLLRQDEVGYRLRLSMRGWGAEGVDTPLLLEWAEKTKPDGVWVLTVLACVGGDPLAPLARQLLIHFGQDESIGESLANSFRSGSWSGSEAKWLETKLDLARRWLNDDHRSVRGWAQKVIRRIETDMRLAQHEEEEQELWYQN